MQAFILAKVSKYYPPSALFPNLPPILHAIATRETIYRLALGRIMSHFPPSQQGKSTMQVQHEEDMKLLGEIAAGGFPLLDASNEVLSPSLSGMEIYSTTMNYNPTFHEGSWSQMVQDERRLDDLIAEREGVGL